MLIPLDPVLHPGDRVVFVCPDHPELCVERGVGPDGTIDLPDIGPLAAALRRPTELAREIAARLDGDRLPARIEVRFVGFAPQEIAVGGAVEHPLRIFAPRGISRERLLRAANPTREADTSLLSLPSLLRPGTELSVPTLTADRRIGIVGSVATPITLPPSETLRLADALASAGGITAHGNPEDIVVVRAGESIPLSLSFDGQFRLRPGDIVRVGTIADRHYVIVKGSVARPGSVEYAPGMTAMAAITAAGGLLPAATGGTLVWTTGTKTFRLSVAFLLNRRIPDPTLSPSDTIEVEMRRS